jgi:hypothetical protein
MCISHNLLCETFVPALLRTIPIEKKNSAIVLFFFFKYSNNKNQISIVENTTFEK